MAQDLREPAAAAPMLRPVLVYDGECSFCRAQIARIRRMDAHAAFEYLPRRAPGLTDRFPQLAGGDLKTGMRLITPDSRVFVGADAVHQIARRLPRWRRLAWLYHMPGFAALARRGYAWVSAHRRSLGRPCEDGACKHPQMSRDTPEE